MDELTKRVLLEIIGLLYSQHNVPLCGSFYWCKAVLGLERSTPCEHVRTCRRHRDITERLLELKTEVLRVPTLETNP